MSPRWGWWGDTIVLYNNVTLLGLVGWTTLLYNNVTPLGLEG